MNSKILFYHQQLKEKKISVKQLLLDSWKLMEKYKSLNSIITKTISPEIINSTQYSFQENNLLSCLPYTLKDNISTNGILTTGGSKFLSNYLPPFSATIYQKLIENGTILIGKDNMDEFSMGASGLLSYYGKVFNAHNDKCIAGGSSSGSAINVATGISFFALATDTGDSIRRPASFNGIVGYKPTYGAISRYGVFPYAPSLDHVGILATFVTDVVIVASKIIGKDEKDCTSSNLINNVQLTNIKTISKINFVICQNMLNLLDNVYVEKFNLLLEKLKKNGHKITYAKINLELLNKTSLIYQIISYTEAISCYGNFTGLTFGKNHASKTDNYKQTILKNRTTGFGPEVKQRFTIGNYLFNKKDFSLINQTAKQLRHAIQEEELNLLKQGDCILMPTVHAIAPEIENTNKDKNVYDDWLIFANLSGTPSISLPYCKVNNMPWGVTVVTDVYQDMLALNIAYTLENLIKKNYE